MTTARTINDMLWIPQPWRGACQAARDEKPAITADSTPISTAVLEKHGRFATDVLAPLNRSRRRAGISSRADKVTTLRLDRCDQPDGRRLERGVRKRSVGARAFRSDESTTACHRKSERVEHRIRARPLLR